MSSEIVQASLNKNEIRNYKIVKSNALIQKSKFNLSSQEQKIILYLISKIKPDDIELKKYNFSIKDFSEICGYNINGSNYKDIKKALKNLSDKSIWIKTDDGNEKLLRWIDTVDIIKNNGILIVTISESIKPYILQLKGQFTSYELFYTLAMKSQYSIRLYELFKSYEWKKNIKISIEELKIMLFAENYTKFNDFKRKVLDISMREINELSDIKIDYKIEKEGRRYAFLIFNIKIKKALQERLLAWKKIDEKLEPNQISLYDKINTVSEVE